MLHRRKPPMSPRRSRRDRWRLHDCRHRPRPPRDRRRHRTSCAQSWRRICARANTADASTRFPPEPNGYLHYGHAKSIILNFGLAAENGGTCHLRYDDTNPLKEEVEFEDAIAESVRWLGLRLGRAPLSRASDYYGDLYRFAEWFIEHGLAYVDSQSADEVRATRGTLTEPGIDSPYRTRSVAENLDLFRRMRCRDRRRARASAQDRHGQSQREPARPGDHRIRHASHHRTGNAWCIYPLYDYTHAISDALERVTHSICTLEFQDHRPLYEWVIEKLRRRRTACTAAAAVRVRPPQPDLCRCRSGWSWSSGASSTWDDPRCPRRGRLDAGRLSPSRAHRLLDRHEHPRGLHARRPQRTRRRRARSG